MINLLPPDAKKQLTAGRANRLLTRYLILFLLFAVLVLAAIGFTYLYLSNLKNSYQETIDQNVTATLHMSESQNNVSEFRANLATAKQILDKQINYSTIILRVANSIPSGVVIDQLSLDPATIGTPTKINAQVKSEAAAERLKQSLNNSPYFDDAYYDTLSRSGGDEYPYNLVFTVTFTQELLSDD